MKKFLLLLSFCVTAAFIFCGCEESGSKTSTVTDSAAHNGSISEAEVIKTDKGSEPEAGAYDYQRYEEFDNSFELHAGDRTYLLDLGDICMNPPFYDVFNDKVYIFCESPEGKASIAVVSPDDPKKREIKELPESKIRFDDIDPPKMQSENTVVGMSLGMTLYKYDFEQNVYSETKIQGGWGMTVDKAGNIYVLCSGAEGKKTVQKFDDSLNPLYTIDVTDEEAFVDYIHISEDDELLVYHYNIEADRMDCEVIDKDTGEIKEKRNDVIYDPGVHSKTSDGTEIWLDLPHKSPEN